MIGEVESLPGSASGDVVVTALGQTLEEASAIATTIAPAYDLIVQSPVLSDDERHGLSIISFVGSVFSPYYKFARRTAGADPENGMVYSADMGIGKVAGIKLDQATGEMKVTFPS